jgi:hypothetical protein
LLLLVIFVTALVPRALNAKSVGDFEFVSPVPGAKYVTNETTIIIRPRADFSSLGLEKELSFTVTGSVSGSHTGEIILSDDGRTVIFEPHTPFSSGERVSVMITSYDAMTRPVQMAPLSFEFEISSQRVTRPRDYYEQAECCYGAVDASGDKTLNDRPIESSRNVVPQGPYPLPPDFPRLTVLINEDPEGGDIFTANFLRRSRVETRYLMILDNTGFPKFFQKVTQNYNADDFKMQPNGLLTYFQRITNSYLAMDNTYTHVDSFTCGNGYVTDSHGLQLLDNGHALLMSYDPQVVDMSEIVEGGNPEARVIGFIIQELDTSKNVVFQWRSWDHFEITDAIGLDLTRRRVDYVHGNAVEPDLDGNILISCRHMSEITKIDRATGDIIWRMGGKNNQFTFVNDPDHPDGFSYPHDCRIIDNGNLTVFDNGNHHEPQHSRGVEYEIDDVNMTATRVWEFRDDPDLFAPFVGNTQRLPNGNTMIGHGGTWPSATEVTPDGKKVWAFTMPEGQNAYRVFRFPWNGKAAAPTAWTDTTTHPDELHIGFVKFGDENVKAYRVYRGASPETMEMIGETPEHTMRVRDFAAEEMMYFRVTALDDKGAESPQSNLVAVAPVFADVVYDAIVRVTPRTLNLKSSGRWISATIKLPDECGCVASDIDVSSIMLNDDVQAEHPGSLEGGEFRVKFPRAEVEDILPEGTRVEIKITGSAGPGEFVGFDTIRVINRGKSAVGEELRDTPHKVALTGNYPNPFNPTTTISYTTPVSSMVLVNVYDAQGRLLTTLVNEPKPAGSFTATWDGRDRNGANVASGVYFVRLQSSGKTDTRKIVLLK